MKAKVSGTKKKINGTTFLLMITILLFVVMYAAGMIVFNDKGFAKPQMFLNLFISNAGLLVIAMGETIVMITAGIDIFSLVWFRDSWYLIWRSSHSLLHWQVCSLDVV